MTTTASIPSQPVAGKKKKRKGIIVCSLEDSCGTILELLRESDESDDPNLAAFNSWHDPNVDAFVSSVKHGGRSPQWYLHSVRVRKDSPPGTGTRFMTALCDAADKTGHYVVLSLGSREPFDRKSEWKGTTSKSRLEKFYRGFGFIKNGTKGRYDLHGSWHRAPRTH